MGILKYNTKKTNLRNNNSKHIDGVPDSDHGQTVESEIASLTLPKSDESTESVNPEETNPNHLFVVDGQECICLQDTISKKRRRIQ